MYTTNQHHNGVELFDLGFLHAGPNWAVCCRCGKIVDLGDPELLGSLFAMIHRILCGDGTSNT
jgi:hypothetical protein